MSDEKSNMIIQHIENCMLYSAPKLKMKQQIKRHGEILHSFSFL